MPAPKPNPPSNFKVRIVVGPPTPLTIVTISPLPAGSLNVAYSTIIQAIGGVFPYTWSTPLPIPGLTINAATGVLSGTPTLSGPTVPLTVRVSDARGTAFTANFTVPIAGDTTAPTVPTGLSANPVSTVEIDLSWNASTDSGGSGLAGYRLYRGGVQIAQQPGLTFNDIGLTPSTLYSYQVSAYDNAGNESAKSAAVSAQTLSTTGTITLLHTQQFTFTGINLVNNTNGPSTTNAPVWDRGQDGVGNVNSAWSYAYPTGNPPGFNLQNVASGVQISGTTINTPFSRVTNFLAGCAYNRVNGAQNGAPEITAQLNTIPAYPYGSYWGYWTREDPNWNYTLAPDGTHDCQRKFFVYTEGNFAPLGGSPEYAFAINSNNAIGGQQNNTATSCEANFDVGSNIFLQIPDINGHNGFWSGLNNRSNPATGWIFVEYVTKWSKGTDGFIKMYENGVLKVNYAGPTAKGFYPQANEAIGLPYTRMYGTAGAPATTNVVYFANTKYFNSLGGTASVGRIYLCNNPVFASATTRVPCLPVTGGSSTGSPVVIDGGPVPSGSQVWVFYLDEVVSTTPQAIMTSNTFILQDFDFFIGTGGVNTNPGTQAQPWAITSLLPGSPNHALMAGKRVGVLPGTYNIISAIGGSTSNDFSTPVLDVPPGTSTAQTVLQSTTPRGAILDGGLTDANAPNRPPLLGHVNPGDGYYTIDGFEVRNSNDRLISVGGGTGGGSPPNSLGIIVQNNYCHGIVSTSVGSNTTAITAYALTGGLIQNNYVTNIVNSQSRNVGIETWSCQSTLIQLNTIIMNNSGAGAVFIKNAGQKNNRITLNYIDLSASPSPGAATAVAWDLAGATTDQSTLDHNVIVAHQGLDSGIVGIITGRPEKQLVYNNTFIIASAAGGVPPFGARAVGQGSIVTYYNNIVQGNTTTGYGLLGAATGPPLLTDYNLLGTPLQLDLSTNGSNWTGYNTLAAWQAALSAGVIGKDVHSEVGAPTFVGGTPTLPAQFYQLTNASVGKTSGSTNGQTTGSACEKGAWGGATPPTQIGCDHTHPANV